VLGLRRRRRGAGRRGVEHRLELRRLAAAELLPLLGKRARRRSRRTRRPGTLIGLAVLGLELRPADHPLLRIEPERPIILARRRHLVDEAEEAAFVGRAAGIEMNLEEAPLVEIE